MMTPMGKHSRKGRREDAEEGGSAGEDTGRQPAARRSRDTRPPREERSGNREPGRETHLRPKRGARVREEAPPPQPPPSPPPAPPKGSRETSGPRPDLTRYLQTPDDKRLEAQHRRRFRMARTAIVLLLLLTACCWGVGRCACTASESGRKVADPVTVAARRSVKIGTFLGGATRDYYGSAPAPQKLKRVWRTKIGQGWTRRKSDEKPVLWSGTGWTGQCTVVEQVGRTWLLVGGYDHNLRKIDARTGKTEWKYRFDDVIKATNTVIVNPHAKSEDDRVIVVSGSRRGSKYKVGDKRIAPLRAISFRTGKELWRLPVPKTANYSQDVDSSPLLIGNTLYAAIESGYVYAIDPFRTKPWNGKRMPVVLRRSPRLFSNSDARRHRDIGGANVALESSPVRIGDRLYISSGSGHVYGLSLPGLEAEWDFHIRSDLDGTVTSTRDKMLLVPVEKQYVPGHGGVFELDPSKKGADAVLWYFPTLDRGISEWKGGVIGSVATNDSAMLKGELPRLAAFMSVDGYLYVVSRDSMSSKKTKGPDGKTSLTKPTLVFRDQIGGGISTPIIVGDSMIAAGFDRRVHLYRIKYEPEVEGVKGGKRVRTRDEAAWRVSVREIASFKAGGPFESTPVVWGGRVFIGCRDGYLYCLGD